jgi:hypothetical protein
MWLVTGHLTLLLLLLLGALECLLWLCSSARSSAPFAG